MNKYKQDLEQLKVDVKNSGLFSDEFIVELNNHFDELEKFAKSQGLMEDNE